MSVELLTFGLFVKVYPQLGQYKFGIVGIVLAVEVVAEVLLLPMFGLLAVQLEVALAVVCSQKIVGLLLWLQLGPLLLE